MSVTLPRDEEDDLLRSVAIQNARAILAARQRAEDALEGRTAELERANALIRTITENAASSLLMLDERGVATYMNPAAVEQTGYPIEEFSRAPFHDMLHPPAEQGGHSADNCPIRIAREQMEPLRNFRDVFVRRDGTTFPVSCSLAPLQREGHAAGAVLEFRDITDELAAQKALEDANRRKDEFLATLSHELRTPMTAILGWARMLELGLPEQDTRDAIAAIVRSAEVQAQLIDDVLDVSRVAAGKMTFRPAPVEVTPVIHAAMTTVHPAAAAKGIEVLASIPPRLPRILGDEGRLQQIIWNLLANAVKFTPRGGTITIRVADAGLLLRITVQDTGKGIEPAYLPHVFEAFSQEEASMTRSHGGIGLGLSIVRSLVELHGGRIRAASEGQGRGATFTVELPVLDPAPETAVVLPPKRKVAAPVSGLAAEQPVLSGVQVLVIDDQDFTRELVAAIFRRSGAEVRMASSVQQGIGELESTPPRVVVCDLAMPEEDGYAFLRAIRARPAPSNATPVIALTAFGRPEDRQHALEAGFNAYLKKPIDPEELTSTVLRLSGDGQASS